MISVTRWQMCARKLQGHLKYGLLMNLQVKKQCFLAVSTLFLVKPLQIVSYEYGFCRWFSTNVNLSATAISYIFNECNNVTDTSNWWKASHATKVRSKVLYKSIGRSQGNWLTTSITNKYLIIYKQKNNITFNNFILFAINYSLRFYTLRHHLFHF